LKAEEVGVTNLEVETKSNVQWLLQPKRNITLKVQGLLCRRRLGGRKSSILGGCLEGNTYKRVWLSEDRFSGEAISRQNLERDAPGAHSSGEETICFARCDAAGLAQASRREKLAVLVTVKPARGALEALPRKPPQQFGAHATER
jgi:hypothetical protein